MEPQAAFAGVSLVGALRGGEPPANRLLFSEATSPQLLQGFGSKPARPMRVAVRSQNRKFIVHRPSTGGDPDPTEVYDLAADPGEQHPLHVPEAELREAERAVDAYLANGTAPLAADSEDIQHFTDELDPELRERLSELGYLN